MSAASDDSLEHLARAAATWLADPAHWDLTDPSLYHGLAGILLGLREAQVHFDDDAFSQPIELAADALEDHVADLDNSSLYFGLGGVAVALQAVGRPAAGSQAVDGIRAQFDGQRWNPMFELFMGNAGIGLAALQLGALDLAVAAVTPYLSTADPTPGGVNWAVRPTPARSHHLAHGTLGIVYALAAVGRAADRADLIELALRGAADVVSRNEAGPDGFLVPHSDPPHRPESIERYSYGWCNGPAGDAQVFRLLARVTGDATWTARGDQCWHTIIRSGLPQRTRPGFWDNNGRCCGTAGVLALAVDRLVESGDEPSFAQRLADDLLHRATVDDAGACWRNVEHRATPSNLPPRAGWAMGNAGILRELLRYLRVRDGRSDRYATPWPDQLPAG